MNWIYFWIIVGFASITIEQIQCSGLFELKMKSFTNDQGKDNIGTCCSGVSDATGRCIGPCKTRFRVCLKHYQAKIDLKSPCTFGDVITPVLGENTFNLSLTDHPSVNGFKNSVRFPFDFAWPGTFTLILESWHETNSSTARSPGILISRLSIQRVLDVSQDWTIDKHVSAHSAIEYQFRVTCDAHYYGSGCANLCRPRDDSFGHYTCSSGGDRVCFTGWEGDYCSKARCLTGCDEHHGHCSKPNECLCQPGWKGAHCDECEPYPGCVHGTCKKPWECICNEGWGGLFCNQDLNFCTNHKPCQNNGTCFNTGQGSYTCNCPPGFTGVDCETKISDCAVNPCLNGGTCHEDLRKRQYKCECQKNWIGNHCEKETITCSDRPCNNGGSCMENATLGFKCDCPLGYNGITCELQVNECSQGPCKNGGTCVNNRSNYQCFCLSGFIGLRCEENIDDCQGNPCLNGGSCVDLVNQYRCQCIPGYIGSMCENKVDLCLTKPCANGGRCTNLNNDYKCTCRPGFTGKDCSIDVDECAPSPCKNGGTCVNRVNSFQCICAGGFRGIMCEEEAFSAAWNLAGSSSSSRHISDTHRLQNTSPIDDGLSNGQIVLIAILSIAVPVIAVVAACIVICMKKQRRREHEKDDAEARKQNEQNASHISHLHHNSLSSKRSSNSTLGIDSTHHMIKNTWDKSVNHVINSVSMDECLINSTGIYSGGGGVNSGGALPSYTDTSTASTIGDCYQSPHNALPQTIQRVKSQKQLNTDPILSHHQQQRASQSLSSSASTPTKDLLLEKRISILSDAALCNTRWGVVTNTGQRQITSSPSHI